VEKENLIKYGYKKVAKQKDKIKLHSYTPIQNRISKAYFNPCNLPLDTSLKDTKKVPGSPDPDPNPDPDSDNTSSGTRKKFHIEQIQIYYIANHE
jgi:hypothetical protein